MHRFSRLLIAGLTVLVCTTALADHPDPLPDTVSSGDYFVRYTDDNPWACGSGNPPGMFDDRNFLPTGQALNMLQAITGPVVAGPGDPNSFLEGLSAQGFSAPFFDDDINRIFVYDCAPGGAHDDGDCDTGTASEDKIRMAATTFCAAPEEPTRRVIGHELFHHVQYAYIEFDNWPSWGATAVEGSARMMEDQIFSDLDDGTGGSQFILQAGAYLEAPWQGFWYAGYDAALGWKYAAEQFGNSDTEPGRGSDFVRRFWENAEAAGDAANTPRVFAETIRDFSPATRMEDWFQDFSIANLVRQYDASSLPDNHKYRYIDEINDITTGYGSIVFDGVFLVPSGNSSGAVDMRDWASAYFLGINDDCANGNVFGFRARDVGSYIGLLDQGDPVRYALFGITSDANGNEQAVDLQRGAGKDFGAAFVVGTVDYEQIAAIVTTTSSSRRVEYQFGCGAGNLTIELPTSAYKAYVGPPGPERQRLIVGVRVDGPASLAAPTIRGLDPLDFEVFVGANNTPADAGVIVSGAEVGETYWLNVIPPDKPDTSTYDLHVKLGGSLMTSQANAVSYEERIVDEVITLDISGSMLDATQTGGTLKIDGARSAAKFLVDRANERGNLGVVVFEGDATVVQPLTDLMGSRLPLKTTINGITAIPMGATSIGDGLDAARSDIAVNGGAALEDWVLLLSDGRETEAQSWDDVRAAVKAAGLRVAAFALGNDADHLLMQEIARETNGIFLPVGASAAPAPDAAAHADVGDDPLANLLADAYLTANEFAEVRERLWEAGGTIATGASEITNLDIEEGGINEAVFAFHWNDPADALTVEIRRPDNSLVTHGIAGAEIFTSDAHVVVHAGTLTQGSWEIRLTATSGEVDYVAALTGRDQQGARLQVYLGGTHEEVNPASVGIDYLWGLPLPIVATLVDDNGPIRDAAVLATVRHPDGTSLQLPLFDDGVHNDGALGDGVYGNSYTRTTSPNVWPEVNGDGSYDVHVAALGNNNLGEPFVRLRKRGFLVGEFRDLSSDGDNDGMPDRFENLKVCLDSGVTQTSEDFDLDGLGVIEEWHAGTDPCHPDSDNGGEADGSEILRGANPFDPRDDALPLPIDPEVIAHRFEHLPFPDGVALLPGANLIRYPISSEYTAMRIWRATHPDGPWSVVTTLSGGAMTGIHSDGGLVDGTTYYYRVQPLGLSGAIGSVSRIFSGTPAADPVQPVGNVIIESGASYTDSTNLSLHLPASSDTIEMKIVTDPSLFPVVPWQPYAATASVTGVPDPDTDIAHVYVRYRDAAGNESSGYYSDSIILLAPGTLGEIRGSVSLPGGLDPEGITVYFVGEPLLRPHFVDDRGRLRARDIPPGTYTLRLSFPGYEDAVLTDIVVEAGDRTTIAAQELTPLPPTPAPEFEQIPMPWGWLVVAACGLLAAAGTAFRRAAPRAS